MATEIWVNIDSGNYQSLPEGLKPMLTDHQWSAVTVILGQFHKRCLNHQPLKLLRITCLKFHSNFPGANELNIRPAYVLSASWVQWDYVCQSAHTLHTGARPGKQLKVVQYKVGTVNTITLPLSSTGAGEDSFRSRTLTQISSTPSPGLILGLRPVNERHRYKVTLSLIGWAQT